MQKNKSLLSQRIISFCFTLIFSFLLFNSFSQNRIKRRLASKSEHLITIAEHISWPNLGIEGSIQIGIYDDPFLFAEFDKIAKKKKIGKLDIVLKEVKSIDNLSGIHLLYCNSKSGYSPEELFQRLGRRPILLVTEGYPFFTSMINFVSNGGNWQFEVSVKNIHKQGLSIDSKLRKLAYSIDEPEIMDSYIVLQEELGKEKAKSEEKDKKIESLKSNISILQDDIELKQVSLDRKQIEIFLKELELDSLVSELIKKKRDLLNTSSSLKGKEIEIDKAKNEYEFQKSALDEQKGELKEAFAELNDVKEEYNDTRKQVALVNRMLDDQKNVTYIAIIILVIISILGGLAFRNYLVQKKQRIIIAKQKDEVEEQKRNVEKQKSQVEEQRDQIHNQHHELEEKNREITDSITYAKRIQEAILPPLKLVESYLIDSFIFYQPKDIVAGDFYWMEANEDWVYFAAADCTGHGVPGAMVSVVCSNALNRSVREYELKTPATILDKTLDIVLERFEKSEEEVKDGMDISLCAYNAKTKELQYAGAHNPLWIIRKDSEEVEEIKGDKQPVGKYAEHKPFTNHKLNLKQGDSIYLFSDGYVDQFGGERGKKFKSVNFKKLLLSVKEKSIQEQYTIIKETFATWKGELEQLDDVCVIGFRA